jgi:hypothetical protein
MPEVQIFEVDTSILLISGFALFSIVGFHVPSLADVTMGTKVCNLPKVVLY